MIKKIANYILPTKVEIGIMTIFALLYGGFLWFITPDQSFDLWLAGFTAEVPFLVAVGLFASYSSRPMRDKEGQRG